MKRSLGVLAALMVSVAAMTLAGPASAEGGIFRASLSGAEEVPARDTLARGQAIFRPSGNGLLQYRLIVANIRNVVASHIHCAPEGVNGPVGVTLFSGGVPGSGVVNGPLASGTITAPDPGNGCGWVDLTDVLEAIASGDTYVNVHTNDGVAPTNTGAGDFPGGEIRGQIS